MNDKEEIQRIHDQWIDLEKSGREKDVLAFCSQDVVWLVPGVGALQGVDEIRAFLIGQPEIVIASIETFNVSIEVSTELAIKKAGFCTTFMDNGSEVKVRGAHIWTLRKRSISGQWQVTSVAWAIEDRDA